MCDNPVFCQSIDVANGLGFYVLVDMMSSGDMLALFLLFLSVACMDVSKKLSLDVLPSPS